MSRAMALALILHAAFGLRLIWERNVAGSTVKSLRAPFSTFPLDIAGPEWKGEDVPLREVERLAIGVTDYIQRRYASGDLEMWFYVGFIGGGASGTIHAPEYCLPAGGYELQRADIVTVEVPGLPRPTRWMEILWRDAQGAPVYSLHTLHYNGGFDPSEWRLRAARILGVPCFAAVNVMGTYTGTLEETRNHYRGVLEKAVPLLLRHLP